MKVRHSLAAAGTSGSRPLDQPRKPLAVVRAVHRPVERPAAFTHPSNPLRRDPRDECVGRNVFRDHGTRGDHRASTDGYAAEDCRVGSNRGSILDLRRYDLPIRAHGTRVQVVREARMGTDEHSITNRETSIEAGEVLNLTLIPNYDLRVDVDILSNVTVPANLSALSHLDPMPNRGAAADGRPGGYLGGRVDSRRHDVLPHLVRDMKPHPSNGWTLSLVTFSSDIDTENDGPAFK